MRDTIAGRFELLTPIAEGGSGAVWRAQDLRLGRVCAAKVLRQRDSADLLRFVREQSVNLEHPHVVAPYGWAAEDEHVAIAMELVSGGTLEAALQDNGPVSDALAEELVYQLLEALQFVHTRGWVHRDVKPANVLLEPTGSAPPVARLADFGIAVRTDDARLTHTGTVVGTPGYLPHEAYAPGNPSPTMDLYAAGVTAVRMVLPEVDLSGDPLGPDDVARLGLFENSPVLRRGVAGLLSREPDERTRAAQELVTALLETAPERETMQSETADGEPFEVFDVLEPTTERELSPVADAARLPPGAGAPDAPLAWHAVHRKALPAQVPPGQGQSAQGLPAQGRSAQGEPLVAQWSGDPLRPFAPVERTEQLPPADDSLGEPTDATVAIPTDGQGTVDNQGFGDGQGLSDVQGFTDRQAPAGSGETTADPPVAEPVVARVQAGPYETGPYDVALAQDPGVAATDPTVTDLAARDLAATDPATTDPADTGRGEAAPRRRRAPRWPWWLLVLALAALALVAGYVWLGPLLAQWGRGSTPTDTGTSPAPATSPAQPSSETPTVPTMDPTTDATPVCTELDDGTVSCVVTP
ncbi:serine/threonine-protein kinase [Kocuria varians]|uniref:Serine/threonine-protein kinase StkP n=1 Tax=Kocuria varians TaxID=1272 RepID=A0A7D7L039_KOCVA|nr:serine/threonine-protein kinase [Kocuria varians]QMS56971.1 Serine/threonine-protein kinase StkP [Kocuria varians]